MADVDDAVARVRSTANWVDQVLDRLAARILVEGDNMLKLP